MKLSPVLVAVLGTALLATTACAPVATDVTRQSAPSEPPCVFASGSCEDLHRLRQPVW